MISWRSARGRAILMGVAFMLLLSVMAMVAVSRVDRMRQQHRSLEHASKSIAALEHSYAQFSDGQAAVVAVVLLQEPALLDRYREYAAQVDESLGLALDEALASGDAERVAALGNLTQRIAGFNELVDLSVPIVLEVDRERAYEMAVEARGGAQAESEGIRADLAGLVQEAQEDLVAERAAADRAVSTTVAILVAFGAVAFVGGTALVVMLVLSVVRPLSSLRASARAITSGDLEARAEVSGPEEVAHLARDFNEMVTERWRAEEALRQARNELRTRVAERTADLTSANEQLQQEVADRKRAEEALRESEAKYRGIFENVQDIYYRTDAQGIITEISPSVERYGYTREELIGTEVLRVYPDPEEREALLKAVLEHGEVVDYEIHLKTGDGRVIDTSVSTHALRGADGSFAGVEGALRDISERKRMEEALREQTRRDPLTGVLNHGAIVDQLRDLISEGCAHAVIMVDVDGLKAVNDTYGHRVGDTVLVTVADALSTEGALVGRYGGDEFVAILPGADGEAAERYHDSLVDTLAEVDLTDPDTGAGVAVVASVGIAIYPTDAETIDELIEQADGQMYAAKRQRLAGSAGKTLPRLPGGDRAAKMVGEIVPLLTSPGDLNDKLRLVAHRLSIGGGYDAASLQVFRRPSEVPLAQNTFARLPDKVVEAWNHAQRQADDVPMRRMLERTRRPIIVEDPQHDELLTAAQRKLLSAAGLRSGLVAPMIWQDELVGHVSVASKQQAAFTWRDAEFLMAVATEVSAMVRTATLVDELRSASDQLAQSQTETVMLLAAAAEARDHTTGLHLQNVRAITEALARELGQSREDAAELALAAVLHDIGKIRVPDLVLSTAGRLTDEEWKLMRKHTVWGGQFLAGRDGFELASTIARSHHERWDGGGYPDGLAGDDIPLAATIVAVADSFDAMTSERPYRRARSVAAAVREVVACSGGQFSPTVVEALVRLHKRRVLSRLRRHTLDERAAA